jgi:hypothetical protein
MSKHFSAKETFAIYGESKTMVTVVMDNLSTEEKTFPTMRDGVDYLKALTPIPLKILLHIQAYGHEISFQREDIAKLIQELGDDRGAVG